jgi:hypothetical protein
MKDAAKVCSSLVEFEERAASLYKGLARRFIDNKDLSWFWLEMSMEERQHALLLDFCGCEQLAVGSLPDRDTIRKLSNLFGGLEKRAAQKDLSVDDAFLIAAELEGSEVNDIYARVIGPIQGTRYIMRKKIETLIPDHMQTLIRGARKFEVSPPTVAKLLEIKRRENLKAS